MLKNNTESPMEFDDAYSNTRLKSPHQYDTMILVYHIEQNFGDGKIWQMTVYSQNFHHPNL